MRGRFVPFKSTALLALAAAVGAGVPFKDAMGHEYHPMPGGRKREGRAHRDGTFTRTGAGPRARNRYIQRKRAEQRAWDAVLARTTVTLRGAMPSATNHPGGVR